MLHLVLGLAIYDLEGLLGKLDLAGVSVLVLEHNLDDVVNLNVAAVTNHILHHFNCAVLVVLFLVDLLHTAIASATRVMRQINRFLQLELLKQSEQKEGQLDLVILKQSSLLGLLTALLHKTLGHVLSLGVHHVRVLGVQVRLS